MRAVERGSGSRTKVVQALSSTPFSVPALRTQMGMNPLYQEQSLVSGENLFLFLRATYEKLVWGARDEEKTLQNPSHFANASSKGGSRSSFKYTFYLGHADRTEYTALVNKSSVL